jgi:hypothetical protein
MGEIMAAPTMDAAFRLFAEVNGLDPDDAVLSFVWQMGANYIGCRAVRAMRKRVKAEAFADELAKEMLSKVASSRFRHN